jgi:hypothetical protein
MSPKDVVVYRILANNLKHFVSKRLGCVGSWRNIYLYLATLLSVTEGTSTRVLGCLGKGKVVSVHTL